MRYLAVTSVILTVGPLLAGCQQPRPIVGPQADLAAVDFDRLWDVTAEVFRRYNFQPDRQDRRAGVMTTYPMTGAQWFEFWRDEVIGQQAQLEANLQTIRRQVTVSIEPVSGETTFHVAVRVDVSRFSMPERQITTPSESLQIFSGRRPTSEGRMTRLAVETHWVPLGRDSRLESQILSRIAILSGAGGVEPVVEPQS